MLGTFVSSSSFCSVQPGSLYSTPLLHRRTPTVIPDESLPSRMDDDTRQKLISLFLVLLMIFSGVAYAASFF